MVPNFWNVLTDKLINTLPIETFKAGLDMTMGQSLNITNLIKYTII